MPRPNPFYDCGSVAPATPSSTSATLATVANATVVKNAEPVPVGSSYMRPTAATSTARLADRLTSNANDSIGFAVPESASPNRSSLARLLRNSHEPPIRLPVT